jgi:glyoxylase I family protein
VCEKCSSNPPNAARRTNLDGNIDVVDGGRGRPLLAGLHHLGISVTSLERSMRFYRDVIGAELLVKPNAGTSASFTGRMAILSLGGRILDLYEHSHNAGERFDPARTGLDHFALEARSTDELAAWAAWLDTCGVARSEIRVVADGRASMFDFHDPDGIQIEFTYLDLG